MQSWISSLVSPTVFRDMMGLYGIMRCGFDFVIGLGAVLITTQWLSVPTEPALWAYLQEEDEATIIRRGASIRQSCAEEFRQGRIVYGRGGKTRDSRPWEGIVLRRETRYKRSLTRWKENAGSKCAIMSTCVGDCQMDGNKP